MIKNILLFIIVSLVGISIFIACTKDEFSSDRTAPTIEIFHPSRDTVIMTDTSSVFKARFRDEGGSGLSAYSIQIWNALMPHATDTFTLKSTLLKSMIKDSLLLDSINLLPDSAIFNKAFQNARISGEPGRPMNDTTVFFNNGFKIDSLGTKNLHIALGKHWFRVSAIDRAGNMTVDSFLIDVIKYTKPY